MTQTDPPGLEALLRAKVHRAVAPYEGIAAPVVLRKMRELAERYWREHPQAIRVLQLHFRQKQLKSGTTALGTEDDEAATGTEKE